MADKNRCDKVFESASKSTLMTAGPTICLIIMAIIIIILSAVQSGTILGSGDNDIPDAIEDSWSDFCGAEVVGYLSPFHFEDEDGNFYGCEWRSRNTIFRVIIASVMVLTSGASLLVLFSGKFATLWPVIYWLNWIIFVMMFVVFVLDCDGVNTGINLCQADFVVDDTPILVRADTLTPFVVEQCKIDPWIWTILCDFIASLVAFCAYKISRYYIFDPTERKQSIGGFGGKTKKSSTANGNGNTGQTTTTATTATTATAQTSAPARKDSDPFAQYNGGYEVDNRKDTGGSAYGGGGMASAYDE
mmetsp:Transcript_12121/g.10798  ORF Transcript_12121/g.10798 Transcript_12121/m.10798 type:complete len:303 (+) Transcript_12121:140-1048(+)|eukprot:CAMPEP_0201581920 /NCGR_PEP_ID=MMETSP0190_2-20130828/77207_1 /ASSEMBLY_ACC=CAM_ASM_000263 /TAXON_ID=37353 /ORGANISM="Rosalina sp." /LENGTH=302 /DNA_ID=CAMNT_0048020819 /DNA_START=66 /DNA_END=974 /DNA_ORIENTATION=+